LLRSRTESWMSPLVLLQSSCSSCM
jgi:hypothetical protein